WVSRLHKSTTDRAMTVVGPPGSGLQFSIKLLHRTLGEVPVLIYPSGQLEALEPDQFVRSVANQLGVQGLADNPVPGPKRTETKSRWLRYDLPTWLRDRLAEDEKSERICYPAWIVIDTVKPPNTPLLWKEGLNDLIGALNGTHEPDQPAIDVPQLR